MESKPLVSILVNNYNYGQFLGEAIDSAINQTYENIEIIVVDDGSTDNSREIIAGYRKQIIPILKENRGQASAFNAGFATSKGEVIFLLDSDDIFVPTKVAEVVNIFNNNSDISWCFHPQKLIDSDCQEIANNNSDLGSSGRYDLRPYIIKGKLNGHFASFGIPATSGLCFRRSLLSEILPMPETETINLSDSYIKYLALAESPGFALAKQLSIQRIHNNNAYTMCCNQKEKAAIISITTAYWMHIKLPIISNFTDNTLAMGLGLYRQVGEINKKYKTIVNQYLKQTSLIRILKIYLKSFYYQFKFR